jgi:cytochrome c peroxidase
VVASWSSPAAAQVPQTPSVVPELPIEIETEVGPAGSLKKVPLWKEIAPLLEDPYAFECNTPDDPATQENEAVECVATTERRPGFGSTMPPLNVFHPCHNVLTGQPLRRRPDGEIDWNQPGLLFDPEEVVEVEAPQPPLNIESNIPAELRTPIGSLVACPVQVTDVRTFIEARVACGSGNGTLLSLPNRRFAGSLVVNNPPQILTRVLLGFASDVTAGSNRSHTAIPPHRTVVAAPSCNADGELLDEEDNVVDELEQPVNENHFFKSRLAAEVLGKALFWDMQVGSDGIQACGSCHFHAGVDNRRRNQLNPNTNGGDDALDLRGPGTPQNTNAINVVASDFPFHKRVNPDVVGDGKDPAIVVSDSNDVMSSMGVSRFRIFYDVPVGPTAFGNMVNGVRALRPDIARDTHAAQGGPGEPSTPDPVAVMQGNRRIEPRNTPTFHSAAFNFDSFWDGRARHDFNGGSVFGPSDPFFHVHVACGETLRELAAPDEAELENVAHPLCGWTQQGGNYLGEDESEGPVPVRIRFSSLASQAVGPPINDFEMSFFGRNFPKIGKKLLQPGVVPLANQLVHVTDSRLGPFSNQGGSRCVALGRPTALLRPGLCMSYEELIRESFRDELWIQPSGKRFVGTAVAMDKDCEPGEQIHEEDGDPTCDPVDGYVIAIDGAGDADPMNTNQFRLIEANFALFFGLAIQAYEQLTIPDDTPWDRFNDANPLLGNGVAQPGEQGTLPPTQIRQLVTGSPTGNLTMVPGFGPEELYGFDIFAGGNLTAALPQGTARNPRGFGSNPFLRTARCMLCHLGPEQSDHTNNVNAGLLQSGTEQEFPFPNDAPEPTGVLRLVTGFSLAEEVEENAQDGVEVENRNFQVTAGSGPVANSVVASASATAFQDNGVYNIGLRPTDDDILRGGDDPFGYPLSLAALALKNLGGEEYEPCDTETEAASRADGCAMTVSEPDEPGFGLYETIGEGFPFPGTSYEQESINRGLELDPADPKLPEYLAEWTNNLPAGEVSPFIDELAFSPNLITRTPVAEYGEILFGADLHCGEFDPGQFGSGPPNWGWGPRCPNSQTGVPTNVGLGDPDEYEPGSYIAPLNGTWPFPNRVARNGASKVPQLRNIELTGPYFHTGSYLTLRQVIDFYIRGGDFPITNEEDRDPNLVDVTRQAFGFGSTEGLDGTFLDGIPDTVAQYGPLPDTDHPETPEPAGATPEQAKRALVRFLLALTDERVAFRRAPFDQPEIFVPADGRAPENALQGRARLVQLSSVFCPAGTGCFTRVPPTGQNGQAARLAPFLVSRTQQAGANNDHFDR